MSGYPRDERAEAVFGRGAVGIHWFVEGPGTFEGAPLQDIRRDMQVLRDLGVEESRHLLEERQFLHHFTWPCDPKTGDRLQWSRLPVVDKVWREGKLPDPHVFKGGFIQEATGWKPSPLQPYVDVRQLGAMAGLHVPGSP